MRMSEQRSAAGPGTPVHGYFFATPALRLRLDLVREHLHNSEAPVLVSGDPGAGKSAFLDQVVCRADSCWRLVRIPPVASISPAEILALLNRELRLPTDDCVDSMIVELDGFLTRIAMRSRIVVVVVDDAHRLADASLARLVALCDRPECTNYRLLLTGLPALRTRLTALLAGIRSPLRPHVVTIPGLDEREVASYIDMKLYYAGVDYRPRLSRQIIDDIAHSSHGHPGRIDAMTDALLSGDRGSLDRGWTVARLRRLVSQIPRLRAQG